MPRSCTSSHHFSDGVLLQAGFWCPGTLPAFRPPPAPQPHCSCDPSAHPCLFTVLPRLTNVLPTLLPTCTHSQSKPNRVPRPTYPLLSISSLATEGPGALQHLLPSVLAIWGSEYAHLQVACVPLIITAHHFGHHGDYKLCLPDLSRELGLSKPRLLFCQVGVFSAPLR